MMNFNVRGSLCSLMLFCFTVGSAFAQDAEITTVNYAGIVVDVPDNYYAKSAYFIENEAFSAQWLYLTKEMVEGGVEKQILKQFQDQVKYTKAKKIKFTSQGNPFSGKIYTLKTDGKQKFRIISFGVVNGQPLILNLGFRDDPQAHDVFDALIKQFIVFAP